MVRCRVFASPFVFLQHVSAFTQTAAFPWDQFGLVSVDLGRRHWQGHVTPARFSEREGAGCPLLGCSLQFCFAGPDVVCRWWSAAVAMAIGWLRGDDAAVRSHFAEVERMPKSLEMSECVGLIQLSNPCSFYMGAALPPAPVLWATPTCALESHASCALARNNVPARKSMCSSRLLILELWTGSVRIASLGMSFGFVLIA